VKRPGIAGAALAALAALGRPAIAVASLGIVFAWFAARSAGRPIDDTDVWWIAAAGRDMLAYWAAPATNTYSFTAPDHPWVMHEIGFGIAYALGVGAFGPAFLPLFSLALAALVLTAAVPTLVARSRHPASAPLVLLLVMAGTRDALFAPRPSHASLIFPVAMVALAFRPGWSVARAAVAILLEAAWANAHGSFPLGIVILAAGVFDAEERSEGRARFVSTLLAALATLANPYGIELHGLVMRYLRGSDDATAIIHHHVVEFFPIWRWPEPFVNPFNTVLLGMVTVLAVSALMRRRSVARATLALALVVLGVYQARHVTLAVVVGALLVHPELDELCAETTDAPARVIPGAWLAFSVIPGLLLASFLWSSALSERTAEQWIAPEVDGPSLWRLAQQLPRDAQVYAPFDVSGLVLWLGAPRGVRVFYDARNDCYPHEVAAAAFALESPDARRSAATVLDRWGTEFALVPESHPVLAALSASDLWSTWRRDGRWIALRRDHRP
jgi:hypothetical protein